MQESDSDFTPIAELPATEANIDTSPGQRQPWSGRLAEESSGDSDPSSLPSEDGGVAPSSATTGTKSPQLERVQNPTTEQTMQTDTRSRFAPPPGNRQSSSSRGRSTNLHRGASSSSARNQSTSRGVSCIRRQPTAEEDDEVDVRTLNTVQKRQLQAHKALRQLLAPPQSQSWSTQHEEILSSNIDLLLNATSDPPELQSDSDESSSERETEESTLNRGTKRPRRHSIPETVLDANPMEDTDSPRQRLRKGTGVRIPDEGPQDLPPLNPQPLRFDFPQHPVEDRSDEWFVGEFRKLFRMMEGFFEEYYSIHNLDEGEVLQPWAVNHTPEFLNYTLEVAEQDPEQGGWDMLLRDTKQRKWLLQRILMRILEVKVFATNLWGATKEEKELMFGIEKALFTQEGTSLPVLLHFIS